MECAANGSALAWLWNFILRETAASKSAESKSAAVHMHRLIYHNDRIADIDEVRIDPTCAGLVYGWGVFTAIGVYSGRAFALDRHWKRLKDHADRARIPILIDHRGLSRALTRLIEANRLENGRARITLVKGQTGPWQTNNDPQEQLLIFTSPEPPRSKNDLNITVSPYRLLSTALFAGVKQTSMLENLFAFEEARSRDFNEAIVLNERGEIVSATAANIFWVLGDEIFTPAIPTGCVAGVTRHLVREIATRWKLHIVEGSFPVQRLLEAREVFLTSTSREVSIVSSFDAKEYPPRQAKIARLISREYQKLIRDATMG